MRYSELNGTLLQMIDLEKLFSACEITSEVTAVGFGDDLMLILGVLKNSGSSWLLGKECKKSD
jgi:hypothetical protein